MDEAGYRRLFFGIPPTEAVRQWLSHTAQQLLQQGVEAANWSAPTLYHLTILFLGDCPTDRVHALARAAQLAVFGEHPFTLTFHHVGIFRRSRALWVGILDDEARQRLE